MAAYAGRWSATHRRWACPGTGGSQEWNGSQWRTMAHVERWRCAVDACSRGHPHPNPLPEGEGTKGVGDDGAGHGRPERCFACARHDRPTSRIAVGDGAARSLTSAGTTGRVHQTPILTFPHQGGRDQTGAARSLPPQERRGGSTITPILTFPHQRGKGSDRGCEVPASAGTTGYPVCSRYQW